MKGIIKKTKKLLTNKIDRLVLMFENENPGFYKEYHELREDHYYKNIKETINQEANFEDLLLDENEKVEAKSKTKPKKTGKANSET